MAHVNAIVYDPQPLTLSAGSTLKQALSIMGSVQKYRNQDAELLSIPRESLGRNSYVLVTQASKVVGILTDQDIIRLSTQGIDFASTGVDAVMEKTSPSATLEDLQNPILLLRRIQNQGIRHLSILDGHDKLIGVVTEESIYQSLCGSDQLTRTKVSEIMQTSVFTAVPSTSLKSVAKTMADYQENSVVICEISSQGKVPIGLITASDIVQLLHRHNTLPNQQVAEVISHPKITLSPHHPLGDAHQQMHSLQIRQLIVAQDNIMQGLVTQSSFLKSLDVNTLAQPLTRWNLQQNLHRQYEFEHLISKISTRLINVTESNLKLEFQTALQQLGHFFDVETCFVFQQDHQDSFQMTYEWVKAGVQSPTDKSQFLLQDFSDGSLQQLKTNSVIAISPCQDDTREDISKDVKSWEAFGFKSILIIPICVRDELIGWFGIAQFSKASSWEEPQTHHLSIIGEMFGNTLKRIQSERLLRTYRYELEDLVTQRTIALTESQEQFRMMADHSPVLIWICGLDQRCTYFNQPWLDFTGRTLDQEIGQGWQENIFPEDLQRYSNVYHYAFESQTEFSIEYRLRRHDGEYRWILVHGVPRFQANRTFCGYVGSCIDVTERIQTEQALVESEERFQLAILGSESGLFDWNLGNDSIYLSPRFKEILGYRDHELRDTVQNWKSHLFLSDRDVVFKAIHEHLDLRIPLNIEHRVYTRDGKYRWVQTCGTAVWNAQGLPIRMVGSIRDVSSRKQMEMELFREKELAQVTLHSIGDAVITTDADGKIEYFNPTAEALTGWTMTTVIGRSVNQVFQLVHETSGEPLEVPIFEAIQTGKVIMQQENTVLVALDGKRYNIADSAAPIRSQAGEMLGAVMVFHDATAPRQLAKKLSWQASHDGLTELINRYEFEHQLQQSIASLTVGEEHVLCFLDLDRFKVVNDACGHVAGDELLCQISQLLRNHIRGSDLLARLGGDEFAVLLKDCNLQDASVIADKILNGIQSYRFVWKNQLFTIGVSIGLVHVNSPSQKIETLLQAADSACYAAKERGRNRTHIYQINDQKLNQRRREQRWSLRLQQALEENRFRLFYQQILPSQHQLFVTPSHAEILVRMISPQGQLVMPGAFISAAERYDLMPLIDRWVIQHSFAQIANMQTNTAQPAATPNLWMINLSGASLGDETLLPFVLEQFDQYQITPSSIGFEITETAAIANFDHANQLITSLQEFGCHFALDDFGSGMSSFGYLKSLPVTYLKIDGQFIRNLDDDPAVKAMVEAINHVGHVMNIQTIAEWVETQRQQEILREIGVDWIQGFGVHKPTALDEHEVTQELRSQHVGQLIG